MLHKARNSIDRVELRLHGFQLPLAKTYLFDRDGLRGELRRTVDPVVRLVVAY